MCPEIGDFSSMFGITAQSMLDLKIPRKLKTVSSNSSSLLYHFYYACWVSAIDHSVKHLVALFFSIFKKFQNILRSFIDFKTVYFKHLLF